ncbi:MAG: serine/threonine-protein phosphatase [Anaerolineales bacterium]|nr:serine/threonine-protein phosphatase [Anaerolineales bacterium]
MNFFKNLFRKKKPVSATLPSNAATAPLSEAQVWDLANGERPGKYTHLIAGSALDQGQRRENNEDSLLCFNGTLGGANASLPLGMYVIADGMGGHRNGEIASETAVRSLGNYLIQRLYKPLFGPDPQPAEESLREMMEDAVNEAHRAVRRAAPGGGCTLTAALVVGNQLIIAHMGDSRAYLVHRDGRMEQLTKDHTLVRRLQEMGQLSDEEAAEHPQKSMLYRAMGQGDIVQADFYTGTLSPNAFLLVCSDGLWGFVEEDDIQTIVNATASPYLACMHLVEAANAAGGPDNISVVLARLVH